MLDAEEVIALADQIKLKKAELSTLEKVKDSMIRSMNFGNTKDTLRQSIIEVITPIFIVEAAKVNQEIIDLLSPKQETKV